MIICAAVKITYIEPDSGSPEEKELIICGHRHCNCFEVIHHLKILPILRIQGFITHTGEFLDRGQAWVHAIDCGQISLSAQWLHKDNDWPAELVSEDLW